jgi:hypothetical protein
MYSHDSIYILKDNQSQWLAPIGAREFIYSQWLEPIGSRITIIKLAPNGARDNMTSTYQ